MQPRDLVAQVLADYALPWTGAHGIAHWARVLENGRRLAATTGADPAVVEHFAILHDARRVSEFSDIDHGPRAAELAQRWHGTWVRLSDDQFARLHRAIHGHTVEAFHPDPTIQTCWDADRLDLGRVGITPNPARLGSGAARDPSTLAWADGRAQMLVIPDLVRAEWGIHLPADPGGSGGHRRVPYGRSGGAAT